VNYAAILEIMGTRMAAGKTSDKTSELRILQMYLWMSVYTQCRFALDLRSLAEIEGAAPDQELSQLGH